MRRLACLGLLAVLTACQAPPPRVAVAPLPDDTPPMPYAELVTRLRQSAMTANEAFYLDRWAEVELAARDLEQCGRFLTRAISVPADRSAGLAKRSEALVADARQLREAATARPTDVARMNTVLQRIHLQVRDLRPGA